MFRFLFGCFVDTERRTRKTRIHIWMRLVIQNCAIEGTAACHLTFLMVLHPLACALSLFAFLFSMGKRISSPQFGVALAALAWILSLVVTMTDFIVFGVCHARFSYVVTSVHIWMFPPLPSVYVFMDILRVFIQQLKKA